MARKLKLLLAVHLIVGISPAAMFLGTDLFFLPAIWALSGVLIGQLMLLSFWLGLGTSAGLRRLLGAALGGLYLAVWPAVGAIFSRAVDNPLSLYLSQLALNAAVLVLFGGIFLLIRRNLVELRRDEAPAEAATANFQFSVLHLMLLTSLVAVILAFVRVATGDSVWGGVAINSLGVVAFVTNILAAPWAALASRLVWLRVTLAILAAVLLGVAMSYAALFKMPASNLKIWLVFMQTLAFALPSVVFIISLLVVRSCGYGLVPRASAAAPAAA